MGSPLYNSNKMAVITKRCSAFKYMSCCNNKTKQIPTKNIKMNAYYINLTESKLMVPWKYSDESNFLSTSLTMLSMV